MNEAYLGATMTTRESLIGCGIFEAFPDNPADPDATGVRNLRESLEHVLTHRQPHTMAVQKYDIRRPEGGFEERYWSPINTPVRVRGGEVEYIVHRVEDVTEFVRLKLLDGERARHAQELQGRFDRMEAEVVLREKELAGAVDDLRRQAPRARAGRGDGPAVG